VEIRHFRAVLTLCRLEVGDTAERGKPQSNRRIWLKHTLAEKSEKAAEPEKHRRDATNAEPA
jgi:hypothetical protein